MGSRGGESSHLIADTNKSDCMKSQDMGIIRFCGIFWKSDGRGERGREGENFYTFIGSKLVGGGGERESLTLTINASYTPLLVLKRRIQFLLITNWRMYGSHFWPKGRMGRGRTGN